MQPYLNFYGEIKAFLWLHAAIVETLKLLSYVNNWQIPKSTVSTLPAITINHKLITMLLIWCWWFYKWNDIREMPQFYHSTFLGILQSWQVKCSCSYNYFCKISWLIRMTCLFFFLMNMKFKVMWSANVWCMPVYLDCILILNLRNNITLTALWAFYLKLISNSMVHVCSCCVILTLVTSAEKLRSKLSAGWEDCMVGIKLPSNFK